MSEIEKLQEQGLARWETEEQRLLMERQAEENFAAGTIGDDEQSWFMTLTLRQAALRMGDQPRIRQHLVNLVENGAWLNGTEASNADLRMAAKLLHSDVAEKVAEKVLKVDAQEHRTLRVNLHLDAYRHDPRVEPGELERMFEAPLLIQSGEEEE